ncbi:MAG: hypothetical protein ACTS4V_01455, partial [Candidatus Hodgkinia cicadicola]
MVNWTACRFVSCWRDLRHSQHERARQAVCPRPVSCSMMREKISSRAFRAEGNWWFLFSKLRTIWWSLNIKPEASGKLVSPPAWGRFKRGQVNQSAHEGNVHSDRRQNNLPPCVVLMLIWQRTGRWTGGSELEVRCMEV